VKLWGPLLLSIVIAMNRNVSPVRIRLLVSAVCVAGAGVLVLGAWGYEWESSAKVLNGVIALLALGLAAKLSAVSLNVGSATFSIAFIPFLASAFLFDPIWAMLIAGASELTVETLVKKKPAIKIAFNTLKEVLAVAVASTVFHYLGGTPSVTEFTLAPIAILGASVAYSLVDSLAVGLAVSVSEGLAFGPTWSRMYSGTLVYDLFASPIPALLAYLYVELQLVGVVALAAPLFVVRHVYLMNLRLEQTSRDLLDLMVKAIEARDPYTSGHSQRVAQYARVVAKDAGLHGRQVDQVATAALLHDVGKIYEDYAPLLRKEGKLTPEERTVLQTHPVRSAELVATISSLKGPVEQAVRYHHENYNGTGYPKGLAGEDIPIGARIIMIADTLDAMTTDRPYRKALPLERALLEFHEYSGIQFDPRLVTVVGRSAALRRLFGHYVETPVPAPGSRRISQAGAAAASV